MLLNAAADVLYSFIVHAAASVPDGVVLHAAANDDAAAVLEGEGGRGNLGLHAAGTDVGLFAKLEHVHVLGVEVRQKPITKNVLYFLRKRKEGNFKEGERIKNTGNFNDRNERKSDERSGLFTIQ